MLHELNYLKRYTSQTFLLVLFVVIYSGDIFAQEESKQKKFEFLADAGYVQNKTGIHESLTGPIVMTGFDLDSGFGQG